MASSGSQRDTPTLRPSPNVTAQNDLVISELRASTLRRRRDSYRNGEPIFRSFGFQANTSHTNNDNNKIAPPTPTRLTPCKITQTKQSQCDTKIHDNESGQANESQRSACGPKTTIINNIDNNVNDDNHNDSGFVGSCSFSQQTNSIVTTKTIATKLQPDQQQSQNNLEKINVNVDPNQQKLEQQKSSTLPRIMPRKASLEMASKRNCQNNRYYNDSYNNNNNNNCMSSPKPNVLLPNFSISPYTERRPFKFSN